MLLRFLGAVLLAPPLLCFLLLLAMTLSCWGPPGGDPQQGTRIRARTAAPRRLSARFRHRVQGFSTRLLYGCDHAQRRLLHRHAPSFSCRHWRIP